MTGNTTISAVLVIFLPTTALVAISGASGATIPIVDEIPLIVALPNHVKNHCIERDCLADWFEECEGEALVTSDDCPILDNNPCLEVPGGSCTGTMRATDVWKCQDYSDQYKLCQAGCFRWSGNPTTCDYALGSADMAEYGVYYCPAEGHQACSENGLPTNGQITVRGTDTGNNHAVRFNWCAEFSDGVFVGSCAGPTNNGDFAVGWNIHSEIAGGASAGTYGGWMRAYVPCC